MRAKEITRCPIYIVVLFLLLSLLADCGADSASPTDPSTTSTLPDIAFFNTAVPSPRILFEGRAKDNTRIQSVSISFDDGNTWKTADIDSSPPNSTFDVAWSYLASATDIPSVMNTVRIRAVDGDANEVVSSPIPLLRQTGSVINSLKAVFSSAASGDVIALSSGIGGAYGDGLAPLTIPIDTDLTVLGSGYGNTATSGGIPLPVVSSEATIIRSGPSAASIFSVDADLTVKNLRLVGGVTAIRVSDTGGSDPQLAVENCLFDGQGAWAVHSRDSTSGTGVLFLSSFVDASSAASTSRGGLYLEKVGFLVDGSEFYYHTDPGGPADGTEKGAGVQIVGGAGAITGSIFDDNALAIWASGTSVTIASCNISGAAFTTFGINLTGQTASPLLRNNIVDGNSGYGVRIGGFMAPEFRNCIISNNGRSGVYIDLNSSANANNVDLGLSNDFGLNDFVGNVYPEIPSFPDEVEVFVSSSTGVPSIPIPADGNYWGVPVQTAARARIYDGYQSSDFRGRITYNVNFVKTFPQNY